jgi:hypothetical protein
MEHGRVKGSWVLWDNWNSKFSDSWLDVVKNQFLVLGSAVTLGTGRLRPGPDGRAKVNIKLIINKRNLYLHLLLFEFDTMNRQIST